MWHHASPIRSSGMRLSPFSRPLPRPVGAAPRRSAIPAMLRATLYRPLRPDETPAPDADRVRLPVERPADPKRPNAGFSCPTPMCVATLVLVETDFDRFKTPFRRRADVEHLHCPCCGFLLQLVGYFEIAHLVPAEG
jgi:hypothetical protein